MANGWPVCRECLISSRGRGQRVWRIRGKCKFLDFIFIKYLLYFTKYALVRLLTALVRILPWLACDAEVLSGGLLIGPGLAEHAFGSGGAGLVLADLALLTRPCTGRRLARGECGVT